MGGRRACVGCGATYHLVYAAPSSFAFGTELIIDGHTYVVEDRGGAIHGNRIDIFFSSHQAALNYGRRTVDVYVK
jgi:3D (Asp-Asp-Asp) domain-containing protein